jgi:hypothetical protein
MMTVMEFCLLYVREFRAQLTCYQPLMSTVYFIELVQI